MSAPKFTLNFDTALPGTISGRTLELFRGASGIKSELEPQRELDLSLAIRCYWNDSGRSGKVIARENDQLGVSEVRMIEDIESLDPELRVQPLLQRNPLVERRVHADISWSR